MPIQFKIHIPAETDEELRDEVRELAHILTGLREAEIKWNREYGAANRARLKYWQDKADQWIENHKQYYDGQPGVTDQV